NCPRFMGLCAEGPEPFGSGPFSYGGLLVAGGAAEDLLDQLRNERVHNEIGQEAHYRPSPPGVSNELSLGWSSI
ncbi:hypothetical protein, partial [Nocardia seriolae]|uniref:hypothetical protein n=1 Tax=Nocardia seriolae TaxID=37332 RepID=UPI001E4EA343